MDLTIFSCRNIAGNSEKQQITLIKMEDEKLTSLGDNNRSRSLSRHHSKIR